MTMQTFGWIEEIMSEEKSIQDADTAVTESSAVQDINDTQEARNKELQITDKGTWLQKNIASLLALLAVIATMLLFYLLIFAKIDSASQNIVLYILGVLSTILSQIFAYYFGSSAGSKAKQDQLFKNGQNGKS